jgi:2-phospho-L-lactate guanylyltransferase
MDVLVPFDADSPKSRLSSVFAPAERHEFALAMLRDVLAATEGAGLTPTVLATDEVAVDARVRVDDRALTTVVNAALATATGDVAILVADLPLATPAAVTRLVETDAEVVLAPGLGGGTNGLVVRSDDFRVDFHGASIRDHRERARAVEADPATVDSFRLAIDVDEPADLAEVLLHGSGHAVDWLQAADVRLDVSGGRVGARHESPD